METDTSQPKPPQLSEQPDASPRRAIPSPGEIYDPVARVLDVGAMGIMVPMVESAEQAHTIAASAKYPPVGRRGAACRRR